MRRSEFSIGFVILLITFSTLSSVTVTSNLSIDNQNPNLIHGPAAPADETPSLTWTSSTESTLGPEPLPVFNHRSLVGDHIVLNATFPEELNVTRCEMRIWSGFTYTTTRPLVFSTDPGGEFDGIIDPAQFDWVVITGIEKGYHVNITCNFTNSDSDFMAWDGTLDQSEFTSANNIVDMVSGDKPENDEIIWQSENDTMILGCLDYSGEGGNWTLHIQVGGDGLAQSNSSTISMDTYYLSASNQTYRVHATGYAESNTTYVIWREGVQICNFFAPTVTVYPIESLAIDDQTFNITWSSADRNADDTTYYSLWLSNNDGYSYMLMVRNLTITWFLWDSSGWLEGDYMVRVRAYSVDLTVPGLSDVSDPPRGYWPGDYRDMSNWIGDPPPIPPPNIFLGIYHYSPYHVNSTGNNFTVHIHYLSFVPYIAHYVVDDNETPWLQGSLFPKSNFQTINITIDGLTPGIHSLTVKVSAEWLTSSLTFNVNVTGPASMKTYTSSTNTLNLIIQSTLIVISIGSATIIGIVVILTLRLKKNQVKV